VADGQLTTYPVVMDHHPESAVVDANEHTDVLPEDLDAAGYVGRYDFPDNSRRRVPAGMYVVLGGAAATWGAFSDGALAIDGVVIVGLGLALFGVFGLTSGWRMSTTEQDALVAAQGAVGFPVGHASAQQVWRGLRSRPTWRVLVYSIEEPPRRRGLVLVDAVDGHVVEHLVEDNPADDLGYHSESDH